MTVKEALDTCINNLKGIRVRTEDLMEVGIPIVNTMNILTELRDGLEAAAKQADNEQKEDEQKCD